MPFLHYMQVGIPNIFVPPMIFYLFSFFFILSSLYDKIFFNGRRKHEICSRSADLLAIKGSFSFEVWVSTWEWKGLFVLSYFRCLCAWVTIKRSLTENYSICLIFVLFSPFFFLLQITVSCIENLPPINLVLGVHIFLTVGDYLSWTKKSGWYDWYMCIASFFSCYNASLP